MQPSDKCFPFESLPKNRKEISIGINRYMGYHQILKVFIDVIKTVAVSEYKAWSFPNVLKVLVSLVIPIIPSI